MKYYGMVEYEDDGNGLILMDADPYKKCFEEWFYEGKLTQKVNLEEPGLYRLYFTYDESENIIINAKEKKIGWQEVEI